MSRSVLFLQETHGSEGELDQFLAAGLPNWHFPVTSSGPIGGAVIAIRPDFHEKFDVCRICCRVFAGSMHFMGSMDSTESVGPTDSIDKRLMPMLSACNNKRLGIQKKTGSS